MLNKFFTGLAAVAFGMLSAQADIPVKLVNNSNGDFADSDVYIAIIGQHKVGDESQHIYYDLSSTASQKAAVVKTLDESANTMHVTADDWGYANVFYRLSDLQDKTIYLGDTFACRMFISFGSPMYLHAFPNGYAGADMNNPSDPNTPIRWELVEFSYTPTTLNGIGQIWINTTRVDAFQYPMGLELYAAGNTDGSTAYTKRGESVKYKDIIDRWNSTLGSTVYSACYSNPITKDNLGGIIKQPSKVESIKNSGIFDDYINKVWDYFSTNTANISMGLLGRWEGQVSGDDFVLTCVEGTYWKIGDQAHVRKPSTTDAIEGAGPFAEGTDIDKTVQSMFCAAFNRGQFRTTTDNQNWDPVSGIKAFSGGTEYPCNEYVKFFHDSAVSVEGGYTYAFAYDDTFEQSATCYSTAPTSVTVTIGGFYNGGSTPVDPPVVDPVDPTAVPSAPTPTHEAGLVKSLYSDTYTSVTPGMFVGSWGQTTQGTVEKCGGNDAYKFTNFNYVGIQFGEGDATVDVKDMKTLHLDLYAPEAMDINIVPISLNPTIESGVKKHLEAGKWMSFDIELSEFGAVDFSKFGQIKFDGGSGQTFYLDNLYTWKEEGTTPVDPPVTPVDPTEWTSVESTESTDGPEFKGNYTIKYRTNDSKQVEISTTFTGGYEGMVAYLWNESNGFAESDMTNAGDGTFTGAINDVKAGDVIKFRVKLAYAGGMSVTSQIVFTVPDNGGSVDPVEPTVIPSAPAPVHPAEAVKSFFSDGYTSYAPEFTNGWWGQKTQADVVELDGNKAYRLTNFDFLGFQMAPDSKTVNITGMQYFHVDLYATEAMKVEFTAISLNPTVDGNTVTLDIPAGEWTSFNLPIATHFAGIDLAKFGQFKLVNATPTATDAASDTSTPALYLDNLYAWDPSSTGVEGVAVDTQATGDIYDLYGRIVRRGTSTDGLPAGIYIVGGRKVRVTTSY